MWNFFEECIEDRSKSDRLHRNVGIPTWREVVGRRKFLQANAAVTPMKIIADDAGIWRSVPDTPGSAMTRGIDARTMSPFPAPAEVKTAERRERERAKRDEQVNTERREAAEHQPKPTLPDGWYGSL